MKWKVPMVSVIGAPKLIQVIQVSNRPIALTNVGYKIFMGLVKSKLVEHLE